MQLVDTVFLILPVATLQAYVGMACSSPESQCPGRNGFDALLFLAVLGAITSGTLCFVSANGVLTPECSWGFDASAAKLRAAKLRSSVAASMAEECGAAEQ